MKQTDYTIMQHVMDGAFGVFISVDGRATGEAIQYYESYEDAEEAIKRFREADQRRARFREADARRAKQRENNK